MLKYSCLDWIIIFPLEGVGAGGGGGGLPILDYTGSPETGTFFRLEVYERVGISRVEV